MLNVYKEDDEDKLCYDVHFWIGEHSTADEYGTAAYKTVELDTLLDDVPVQHREVQGHESALFKSYFPEITYMSGGCPSGFNKVHTREYTPRLFHFRGERRNIIVREVPMSRKALDETDVYILDLGERAYQWNSRGCNKDERFKAAQYLQKLSGERFGRLETEVIDQEGTEEEVGGRSLIDKVIDDCGAEFRVFKYVAKGHKCLALGHKDDNIFNHFYYTWSCYK